MADDSTTTDTTGDLSQVLPTSGQSPLETASTWMQDPTHTASDLFQQTQLYDPSKNNDGFLNTVLNAAQDTAKTIKPTEGYRDNMQGFQYVAHGLYDRGFTGVGMEQTKPPKPTRPAQVENAREVWAQWYSDMKRFGYSGK